MDDVPCTPMPLRHASGGKGTRIDPLRVRPEGNGPSEDGSVPLASHSQTPFRLAQPKASRTSEGRGYAGRTADAFTVAPQAVSSLHCAGAQASDDEEEEATTGDGPRGTKAPVGCGVRPGRQSTPRCITREADYHLLQHSERAHRMQSYFLRCTT
jgi:hypothetical protein